MHTIKKFACVVSVVLAAGLVMPAMAATSNTISYAYFDASGHFVGQSLLTCSNTHLSGGSVTQYVVVQSYPCYMGAPGGGDAGVNDASLEGILPSGFTLTQACAVLAAQPQPDYCGNLTHNPPEYFPPIYAYQ